MLRSPMRIVRQSVLGIASSPSRQEARKSRLRAVFSGLASRDGTYNPIRRTGPVDVGTVAEQARDGRYRRRLAQSSDPRVTRLTIMVLSSPGPMAGQTTSYPALRKASASIWHPALTLVSVST